MEAERLADLRAEGITRHRRQPESRREAEGRHAAEHQVGAHLLARRLVGLRAAALREREDERVQHAGARRVARERGRDDGVEEEHAVSEAERRFAEERHDEMAEPLAEAALHDRPRDEEGDDDQEDRSVREPGVGLRGRQDAREDADGDGEDGSGQDREGAHDDREDRRGEDREEAPRLRCEALRHGPEPDGKAERDGDSARNPRLRGGAHFGGSAGAGAASFAGARRERPSTFRAIAWNSSSPASTTNFHENVNSPSRPAQRPVPPVIVPVAERPVPRGWAFSVAKTF